MIFSRNIFDFENNFRIGFRNSSKVKTVNYLEVCEYIKQPVPKNLLIYRLLVNDNGLDPYSTKYGFFIRVKNSMELVYMDPIFALRDIRHLKLTVDPAILRFKVQQVGLTAQDEIENEALFDEKFSFDLKSKEAKNQNDSVFAEAIFHFDSEYQTNTSREENLNLIVEDEDISEREIYDFSKIDSNDFQKTKSIRSHKSEVLQRALKLKEEDHFESTGDSIKSGIEINDSGIDLFKSTNIRFNQHEKNDFVLKIGKK
ncbi:MAG: hypothetical protein K9J12_09780 [Melioribacteraceae bacterium]|nr:hypothetical protein [Melioribacteraceae bacterium]MCF8266115.1 hypothetical protein [Melioribacteraceae bacterium]MCF8431505.1 hypothetical protein [Melioribacteraceae bacterium]